MNDEFFDLEAFNREHLAKLKKMAEAIPTRQSVVEVPLTISETMSLSQEMSEISAPYENLPPVRRPIVNEHDESLDELAERKKREQLQYKLSKATERAIASKTKQNAAKRETNAQARFFARMVELASFRDERGHYVAKENRKEEIKSIRKRYAKNGCQRANLASRHSSDKRLAAIVNILSGLSKHYKQKYCYPSQETIQWMLWRHYGILSAISTLNNDIDALDDAGYIRRKRRLSRVSGKFTMSSTLYLITKTGASFMKHARKLFGLLVLTVLQNFGEYMSIDKSIEGKEGERQAKDALRADIGARASPSACVEAWEFV